MGYKCSGGYVNKINITKYEMYYMLELKIKNWQDGGWHSGTAGYPTACDNRILY